MANTPVALAPMTDAELAALLDKLEIIEPYIAAVRTLAHERLEAGAALPGWKLVPKRATRKWKDEDVAWRIIVDRATDPAAFQQTRIASPAQAEKAGGKKFYAEHLAPLVEAVSSGTTLAPTDDPRPALETQAASVFRLPFPI